MSDESDNEGAQAGPLKSPLRRPAAISRVGEGRSVPPPIVPRTRSVPAPRKIQKVDRASASARSPLTVAAGADDVAPIADEDTPATAVISEEDRQVRRRAQAGDVTGAAAVVRGEMVGVKHRMSALERQLATAVAKLDTVRGRVEEMRASGRGPRQSQDSELVDSLLAFAQGARKELDFLREQYDGVVGERGRLPRLFTQLERVELDVNEARAWIRDLQASDFSKRELIELRGVVARVSESLGRYDQINLEGRCAAVEETVKSFINSQTVPSTEMQELYDTLHEEMSSVREEVASLRQELKRRETEVVRMREQARDKEQLVADLKRDHEQAMRSWRQQSESQASDIVRLERRFRALTEKLEGVTESLLPPATDSLIPVAGSDEAETDTQVLDIQGELSRPLDGPADDLTKIQGIGPKYANRLNELGIRHFEQMAKWRRRDMERIAAELGVTVKRIESADWVGQAKSFAEQ